MSGASPSEGFLLKSDSSTVPRPTEQGCWTSPHCGPSQIWTVLWSTGVVGLDALQPTASSPPLPDPKGARPALRAWVHLLWLTPSTHKAQYSHMYKYLTKTV